jgi:hypothetical protein
MYSNAKERERYSEHPFIFILASYLGGIIIPLPTLSRPGRDYSKREKETISAPTVFQRRFSQST